MSTCTGRGSQAARCPPANNASDVGPRAYRTGGSSDTQTISLCSGTATEDDVEALREEISAVLATMGLTFSEAKTRVVHMAEGFDFLGFHIQWRRKRGTNTWHVYTFIADRPIRSLKAKIRALTNRTSQQHPGSVLIRLAQIMRGWSTYFRHAVCKHTFSAGPLRLAAGRPLADGRLHRWRWTDLRQRFTSPRDVDTVVGGRDHVVQPRSGPGHPISLPRHTSRPPGRCPPHNGSHRGEPVAAKVARRVRRAAWGNGREQSAHRAPDRLDRRGGC